MKRRAFIAALGSAAAWPLVVRGQQGKLIRLGYLDGGARADTTTMSLRHQFVLGMRDLGYIEGRDYLIEERYAAGQLDRFMLYAQELVDLPVDVIVAGGEAGARAAKRATSKIPIVMPMTGDPIGSGLVPNLAQPGGNLTGMTALRHRCARPRER
jgi:putative ABC transport system substrate-binding protein